MNGPSFRPRCKDAQAARSWATAQYLPALYQGYGILWVSRILSSTKDTVDFVWPTTSVENRGRWMLVDVVGLYDYDEEKTKTAKTIGYVSQKRWKAEAQRIRQGVYRIPKDQIATSIHDLKIKMPKTQWHPVAFGSSPPLLRRYVRLMENEFRTEWTMDMLEKWIRLRIELLTRPSFEAEAAIERGYHDDHLSFLVLSEVVIRFASDALFEWWRTAERQLYEARVHSSFKAQSQRDGIPWSSWLDSVGISGYKQFGLEPNEHIDSHAYTCISFEKVPWLLSSKPLLVHGDVYVTPELLKTIVLGRYRSMVLNWMTTCRDLSIDDRRMVTRLGSRGHRYPNPHLFELVKMAAAIEKIVQPSPTPSPSDDFKSVMASTKDVSLLRDRLPPCAILMIDIHRRDHHMTGGNDLRFHLSILLRHLGLSHDQMKWLLKLSPSRSEQLDKEIKAFWSNERRKYKAPTCSVLSFRGQCPVRCVDPLSRQPVSTPVELTRARIQIEMDMSM
jgi:hypothetical protein